MEPTKNMRKRRRNSADMSCACLRPAGMWCARQGYPGVRVIDLICLLRLQLKAFNWRNTGLELLLHLDMPPLPPPHTHTHARAVNGDPLTLLRTRFLMDDLGARSDKFHSFLPGSYFNFDLGGEGHRDIKAVEQVWETQYFFCASFILTFLQKYFTGEP